MSAQFQLRLLVRLLGLSLGLGLSACAQTPPENEERPPVSVPGNPKARLDEGWKDEPTPAPAPTPLPTPTPVAGPRYDLPLRLPGATVPPRVSSAADLNEIKQIQEKQKKFPTYAAWRRLAEIYLKNFAYADAAKARRAEAAMYRAEAAKTRDAARKSSFINAALVQENDAARYETSVQIGYERQATANELKRLYRGAPLEPIIGCYLGAFIDRDDQLKEKYFDENWQEHRTPAEFTRLTGVPHATNFMYVSYGQKFPRAWVEKCKQANVIPHVAWEPKNLNLVRDDAYLQGWAKAARAAEWPIFIRFAGEMNGFWTPYHGNPALYREKFRLVHRTFRENAPLSAVIWCVNSIPVETIQDYYPGDNGCDWVGINLYSVPFYDNDPKRPALNDNPTTLIEPIYKLYADKKPIAICEYAASHRAALDKVRRNAFAIDKMAQLYSALPVQFPRIKMINWFSMNTMKHALPGRQLNDYNLTSEKEILDNYRQIVSQPFFLKGPEHLADPRPPLPFPLPNGQKISAAPSEPTPSEPTRIVVLIKTYLSRPKIYAKIGTKIIYAANRPGAHSITLDMKDLPPGNQTLTIYAFDDKNRFITSAERKIVIAP